MSKSIYTKRKEERRVREECADGYRCAAHPNYPARSRRQKRAAAAIAHKLTSSARLAAAAAASLTTMTWPNDTYHYWLSLARAQRQITHRARIFLVIIIWICGRAQADGSARNAQKRREYFKTISGI